MKKSENEVGHPDRRGCLQAPLVPLLRRFQFLQPINYQNVGESDQSFLPNGSPYSPTECLLRFLKIPINDEIPVDLRQTAVVIMAHLGMVHIFF